MIEVILHRYLSKTFLSDYAFGGEIVVVEDIVGAIVKIILGKVEALGFIPVWWIGVDHSIIRYGKI